MIGFTPLLRGISRSVNSFPEKQGNLSTIRWRIHTVRRELTVEPFICGLIYLLFAFWPYLRMKSVYQYPIQVLLWILMCLGISVMISISDKSQIQNAAETVDSTSKRAKQEDNNFDQFISE